MENTQFDYSPDNIYPLFKKRAIRCSVIFILLMCIITLILYRAINYSTVLLGTDLKMFKNIETSRVMLINSSDGMAGGDEIKVSVRACSIKGDNVEILLYGENNTDREWTADGNSFVLSTFNTKAAETRYHYYSQNCEFLTAKPNQSFLYKMTFKINNLENKISNGYVFSLSAFRNSSIDTVEIVIDELNPNIKV